MVSVRARARARRWSTRPPDHPSTRPPSLSLVENLLFSRDVAPPVDNPERMKLRKRHRMPEPPAHPRTCPHCHGTGWTDAPPVYEIVNGEPHPYTMLARCTHDPDDLEAESG